MQPRAVRRCICLVCRGRGFLPGALSSTKQIFPFGRMMMRSGMPAFAGLASFGAIPPAFLVARTKGLFDGFFEHCFSFWDVCGTDRNSDST